MQYTTHYNLNLPEGTDIVNPLVQDNPNYSAIDTALYDNKVRVVGNATEVKSGTVHAITRSDSDIDVIKFTATGDWITGNTMTVDGAPVSVYLPDGTAPLTGAYVINTEVIAVINGSRVTLYGAQKLPSYTASDISYDNTQSGLAATDVQDAIDEVAGLIGPSTASYISATLNTIDWSSNSSKIIKLGNLVIINYYVQGVPTANKTLIRDLPLPSGTAPTVFTSGATPSIIGVDALGNLTVISSGSASPVFLSGVYVYVAA